ncbi:hypothetical protein LTS18_005834 [Coniosporium uncinatum]|uniref:Uncharacterized protein n=1 Tax=Coniosporium uncinatum TaxID=93489 RepID=A0ACC3DQQ6_9PEZI|nr:hypothetical protein LTS18_005834 [Coniosporium uncinatum]
MSTIPPALEDEITSIDSIYPDTDAGSTLELTSSVRPLLCLLRLPNEIIQVALRLEFPVDYPDAPPSILGTESVGANAPKGFGNKVVEAAREVLANVYQPGEPCIFDLINEILPLLEAEHDAIYPEANASLELVIEEPSPPIPSNRQHTGLIEPSTTEPPWTLSDPLTEKKSVFLARCAPATSPAQAKSYIAHLLSTDKRAAKATHNITAWRIRAGDAVYQDCDDDGETAAGGRLLKLMQMVDVWDVVVVVTRWYGGVLLGPARFGMINAVAREALVRGGFVKEEGRKGKK